jgi:N-acyl-D-amino-acid deacylase
MSRRPPAIAPLAAIAVALLLGASPEPRSSSSSFLVRGAGVADGTGRPIEKEDVRVEGDRILEVGRLEPRPGERVLEGEGLVLAPGFIDVHNHSAEGLKTDPLAETQVSQGITTVVVGPDGDSPWPIAAFLEERRKEPASVNVMTMVGHETVRHLVMGEDYRRAATSAEIGKMAALVDQGMREGALGLSSGLEYDIGSYATTDELVALSRAAASRGGFYMTHIRDEADRSFEAFAEAIAICERGGLPLQVSHIKLGTVGVWGKAAEAVALFDRARAKGDDITADCYPYEAWHSDLYVIVPDKKYFDPESVARGLADVGGASHVTITACKAHPAYAGRNLEEIARAEGISPVELFSRIIRDGGADVIGHSMTEEDMLTFYRQPWVMVASDGGIANDHPRGAGTFPRVLGRFVREKHVLTLAEAVRKMTSLPARRVGLRDRGRIAPGMKADLVLFDPETVIDRSTFEEPRRLATGITAVVVNGEIVWAGGRATGSRPGKALAGPGKGAHSRSREDLAAQ